MKTNFLKLIKLLPQLAFYIIIISSFVINYISFDYIGELENQVAHRDSIISRLTFSNDLVKEYFDIEEDTLNKQRIYTLKDEKRTKRIEVKTVKYVEHSFVYGTDTLTIDELLLTVNKSDSIYKMQIDSLCSKYNSLITEYNNIQREQNNLKDSIISQRMALDLIKRNYSITHSWYVKEDSIHVKIESSKADSAFMLYPYFKDRLKFDNKKKSWVIKK